MWCSQSQSARWAQPGSGGFPPGGPGGPGGRPPGGPPVGGPPEPPAGFSWRRDVLLSSAAEAMSSESRESADRDDGRPSSAAFTASIGSRKRFGASSLTGGRIVVSRSSAGTAGRRDVCRGGTGDGVGPASAPAPFGLSAADWSCCPLLFTGRAGAVARRPGAACLPRRTSRACRAEHIRLDQVIPAAGSAYLHHVYGELFEPRG